MPTPTNTEGMAAAKGMSRGGCYTNTVRFGDRVQTYCFDVDTRRRFDVHVELHGNGKSNSNPRGSCGLTGLTSNPPRF